MRMLCTRSHSVVELLCTSYSFLFRPQSVVEYSVPAEYSSRLSVTKSGLLKAKSISGAAVVIVRRTDLPDNETSVVPVTVRRFSISMHRCGWLLLDTGRIHCVNEILTIIRRSRALKEANISSALSLNQHRGIT